MKQRQNMPYLLQLQQQSRLYLTSTMVLTFFIAVCFCLYQSPWQPQRQGAMLWQRDGSDAAVAQQQVPEQQEQPPSLQKAKRPMAQPGRRNRHQKRQRTAPAEITRLRRQKHRL